MGEKYGFEPGGIILAEEKHQPLFAEMVKRPGVQYIAGGATQNSIRVAQWMLQTKGATAYMGCIGKDANGDKMRENCEAFGVVTSYMVDEATPTGSCACLIEGIERSLCTNLCAANNFKIDHVNKPENIKLVKEAKIIYSAGFFITVSTDSMKLAQAEAAKSGAKYCLNLSAPFLMQVPPFKRTVVITQGSDPTIVCVNGMVTEHAILALPKEKLKDTNGAGDAYVGGFLAGLSKGLPVADCCKAGAYSASVIVQHSGCTFPATPDYKL